MQKILAVFILIALSGCGSQTPTTQAPTRDGPAPIDPGVYTPYDKVNFSRAFKAYGTKGIKRIDRLRVAAAEAVAQKPECDAVTVSELSEERSTPPNHPVVFVDCQNTTRFYMSEDDIGSIPESETERGARISSTQAIQACTEKVKSKLKFPGEFRKDYFTVSSRQAQTTGNWVVDFDFKAVNGLGMRLPESAHCTVDTSLNV